MKRSEYIKEVLSDLTETEIRDWCLDNDINIEVEVEVEVEVDTPPDHPYSGPPQNLFEELCNKFDLPRGGTTKGQLLSHIASLL